ncbi:uncharacterized protein [Haliotis asinina]|uniref:uncharacterized protein n=1 Tax=Haliotis asinina TaxID=109174 RepID=UPI00353202AC
MPPVCVMPPSPVWRRGFGVRGILNAATPRPDFRLDVTRAKANGNTDRRTSAGHRCPNLGPTRQDTQLFFRQTGRSRACDRRLGKVRDSYRSTSVPPKTAPSSVPFGTLSTKSHDPDTVSVQSNDSRSSGTGSSQRLCVTSLVLRKDNSSALNSRQGTFVRSKTEYYDYASSNGMLTSPRRRMYRRSDRVIVPSKYGYHPRSHSPTFKCLIQASDKLNRLLETVTRSVVTSTASSDTDGTSVQGSSTLDDTDSQSNQSLDLYDFAVKPYKGYRSSHDQRSEFKGFASDPPVGKHHVTPRTFSDNIKVAYKQNGVQGTELHLFLPNIVPSSGDCIDQSPDPQSDQENSSMSSKALPTLNNKLNYLHSTKPSNGSPKRGRVISRRTLSQAKSLTKDKQRKGRNCEEREPFIRGESLKERLDDFPTLVSLDAS